MDSDSRSSIVDAITKSSGYSIALMTTFNFDIGFFERAIVNPLYENNTRKISVFVDCDELTSALYKVEDCQIGRKYVVNPVRINSSFHPKVFLLLGKENARLIVGSANITPSGFAINNEIFNVFEYSKKEPKYLDVILSAIRFFLKLNELSYNLDNEILNEVKRLQYYNKADQNGEAVLLDNIEKSLLDNVKNMVDEEIEQINIAVPYYDNQLSALKIIKAEFPKAIINLYLQNGKSTFPVKYNQDNNIEKHILLFGGFLDDPSGSSRNFYHGKVFLFKGPTKAFVLYGSANCTQAALTRTYKAGGNIECDIMEIGSKDEFDEFFTNFELLHDEEIKANTLLFETVNQRYYYFKYGELKDNLELHFGYSKDVQPKVFVGDLELPYIIADNELIINVLDPLVVISGSLLVVDIKYNGIIEEHKCWYNNVPLLNINRLEREDKYAVESFSFISSEDKYRQDRYNLINAERMCLSELQTMKHNLAQINKLKEEQESDDSDDEFIIDIEIPEEYSKEYRIFETVSRIRSTYIKHLFSGELSVFTLSDHKKPVNKTERSGEVSKQLHGENISEDKQFARYIKSRVTGLFDDKYIDNIEPRHYFGILLVILEIFNKYKSTELFDFDYMYNTRSQFFINLLRKEYTEELEDIWQEIVRDVYYILIDNYFISTQTKDLNKKEEYDSINKKLLLALDKKCSIRSTYMDYLNDLQNKDINYLPEYDKSFFSEYIDNLFGYKNKDLLVKFIKEKYKNASVEFGDSEIRISSESSEIKNYLSPNINVLIEIRNFSEKVKPVKNVEIDINYVDNDGSISDITRVEHSVNYKNHDCRTTIFYKSGQKYAEKPEYIGI